MFIIGCMGGDHRSRAGLSRRELLKRIAGMTACIPLASRRALFLNTVQEEQKSNPSAFVGPKIFSDSDDALLEALEALNFLYFWEQANPDTGIVRDRCNVRSLDKSDLGSIAATGFGLTALCIGVKHGFVSFNEAGGRALNALRFLSRKLPHH